MLLKILRVFQMRAPVEQKHQGATNGPMPVRIAVIQGM